MSLRTRFTIAALALVVAVLASKLVPLYFYERHFLLAQMDQQTVDAARKLAQVCEESVATQSDLVALNYFRVWLEGPGALEVVLLRRNGTVYLDSRMLKGDNERVGKALPGPFAREALAGPGPISELTASQGTPRRWVSAPVTVFNSRFGAVLTSYDEQALELGMQLALDEAVHRGLVVMSFALGVGVLLAFGFAASLNRPIAEIVAGARRIGSGDFTAMLSVHRSDELGRLAQEFNLMAQRLRDLEAMKDRFLHSVSHEMRAPLAVMASAGYHARRVCEPTRSDGLREDIAQIEKGIDRLTAFVDNILDLARLQAGRVAFSFAAADPGRLLEEAKTQFSRRAEDFHLSLDVALEGEAPAIRADPSRLQQVLANLILNAFKFSPDGALVRVRARLDGDAVVFSVSDAGPGIPRQAQASLFTRFTPAASIANQRRLPSSGLGLSICKEIVEAHGGRIWFETQPGKGSTFLFSVPLWRAAQEQLAEAAV